MLSTNNLTDEDIHGVKRKLTIGSREGTRYPIFYWVPHLAVLNIDHVLTHMHLEKVHQVGTKGLRVGCIV